MQSVLSCQPPTWGFLLTDLLPLPLLPPLLLLPRVVVVVGQGGGGLVERVQQGGVPACNNHRDGTELKYQWRLEESQIEKESFISRNHNELL